MPDFSLSEIYAQLDKAIVDIKNTKAALDTQAAIVEQETDKLRELNDAYIGAIRYANELKGQLTSTVDKNIPTLPTERISK